LSLQAWHLVRFGGILPPDAAMFKVYIAVQMDYCALQGFNNTQRRLSNAVLKERRAWSNSGKVVPR
jgi:hypothetical protein